MMRRPAAFICALGFAVALLAAPPLALAEPSDLQAAESAALESANVFEEFTCTDSADCLSIQASGQDMLRLYNPYTGEHFYTASAGERDNLTRSGWRYEGVGWTAPTSGTDVHRLYNPYAGDHHYTTSAAERDNLTRAGWRYEGVGWRSGGSYKIYRQYNPNAKTGAHNFTASVSENNSLASVGWRAEGVSWYAAAIPSSVSSSNSSAGTAVIPVVADTNWISTTETTKLLQLKSAYYEGRTWTNSNEYLSKRLYYSPNTPSTYGYMTGGGCAALAYLMQDQIYGSPWHTYDKDYTLNWGSIRPGDHLRVEGNSHSVVVLQKSTNAIKVVEGNYNGRIHWGRIITLSELRSTFTYREYSR